MDRGVKASELIRLLQDLISQHGDLDVFKERNGSARPIYFAEYYQQENHFELSNNEKQKIFEVFHKNEIVYLNQKKEGKNNPKNCSYTNHKCFYCMKKFRNIYQFEIHMKIHVSYN